MNFMFLKTSKHLKLSVLLLYFLFFLLLFLQLPLKEKLPGNCDTWLAITYSSYSFESAKSYLSGEKKFHPMYPVENPLVYGESAPGLQVPIIILKSFGLSDHWAYYFFISLIFALTAFGIFIFTGNFVSSTGAGMFAGFVFTVNNMSLAHIDDPIIIFFFLPAVSLHFLLRYFENRNLKHLVFAALFAGMQIYFSFYLFFYLALMIFVFYLFYIFRNKREQTQLIRSMFIFAVISGVVSMPHLLFHMNTLYKLEFVEIFQPFYTAKMASLNLIDLFLVLPGNLLYPDLGKVLNIPMNWGFVRHYNFTGLLIFFLFSYSLFKWNRQRILFGSLAFAGIFFAMGPVFMFNFQEVFYSPLYVFYKFFPILAFLRVAVRVHFIFLFAVSVGAAISAERIVSEKKYHNLIFASFFIFHFFESVPFPIKGFDASSAQPVPMIYRAVNINKSDAVIAVLPSRMDVEYLNWDDSIFNDPHKFIYRKEGNPRLKVDNISMFVNSWDDIFQYNREIIYTLWQTSHKIDSVNGVNGYFPVPRMMYQYHINRIPDTSSFSALKKWGVDYIVWHEFMKIEGDTQTLEMLENSPCLKRIYAEKESYLFKLEDCDG
jgi:hypothetical protein